MDLENLDLCICCKKGFTPRQRGFHRFKVTAITDQHTFTAVFRKPSLFQTGAFICRSCYKILVAQTRPVKKPHGRGIMRILKDKVPKPDADGDGLTLANANERAREISRDLILAPKLDSLCICCKKGFTPKKSKSGAGGKGFHRFKVTSITDRHTFTAVFRKPPSLFQTGTFICRSCYKILVAQTHLVLGKPVPGCRRSKMRILDVPKPAHDAMDADVNDCLRKETILMGMHDYCKPTAAFEKSLELDSSNKEARGGKCNTYAPPTEVPCMTKEAVKRRAMANPRVKKIMEDPAMRMILAQMQSNPGTIKEHLQNPLAAANIQTLMDVGLISLQSGPSILQSGSSRLQSGPSSLQSGPSSLQSGPSRLQSGPSRLQSGPSRLQSGPSRLQSGPSRLQSVGSKVAPGKRKRGSPLTSPTDHLLNNQDADMQTDVPPSSPLSDDGEQSVSAEVDDDLPSLSPECSARPKTPKERAVEYIEASRYQMGFRKLCANYPSAKRALIAVMQEMIREEVKVMRRKNNDTSGFSKHVSIENVEVFRWDEVIDETKEAMPVAVSCMSAMMPNIIRVKLIKTRIKGKTGSKRAFTDDEAKAFINRQLGQVLAISLFAHAPHKFKFVQTSMAIELWRQGASKKVFKMLNHSGITLNGESARFHVDALAESHDHTLKEWKKTIESTQETLAKTTKRRKLQCSPATPTFGLCMGNVHKWTEPKNQGRIYGNLQTMCYAARDRVQPQTSSSKVVEAESLDPFVFLPSPAVITRQRLRLVDVVANIMGRHMKFLKDLLDDLPITREHEESAAMSQKSQMVTLGTVNANPGTTEGMVKALEHLQQYVPVTDGKPNQTLVSGDGLAIKRILHVQRARTNGENWKDRLDAFTPAPQEFHKEVLLLQDSNNVFFRGKSTSEKGTIAQLKQDFNHIDFRKEVARSDAKNIQYTWDMYEFVTEGYTLLCALKLCGTSSLHKIPPSFPADGSRMEQLQWVETVAQRVVDFVYHQPERSSILVAAEAYRDDEDKEMEDALVYCHCRAEKDDEVIMCCSAACQKALYHVSCVGLTTAPDDDWYCSDECESSPSYIYCLCKMKDDIEGDSRMVQCALQGNCRGHEWYHHRCVGLQVTDVLPEKWYCGEACALDSENDDHVLNHSKALTLEGLRHLARRAAVQAGNGPVMVEDWKMDLLTFWSRRHTKYLINAHHFLACVGGFAPENIRTSLIWNRVINVSGRPEGNIGMDLGSEHINQEYKDTTESAHGNVYEKRADNAAKMSGPFSQYLDTMFSDVGIVATKTPTRKRAENMYKQDVQSFVKESRGSALFEYLPFREHKEFENFDGKDVLRDPRKLGQKLRALSRRMDSQRRIVK